MAVVQKHGNFKNLPGSLTLDKIYQDNSQPTFLSTIQVITFLNALIQHHMSIANAKFQSRWQCCPAADSNSHIPLLAFELNLMRGRPPILTGSKLQEIMAKNNLLHCTLGNDDIKAFVCEKKKKDFWARFWQHWFLPRCKPQPRHWRCWKLNLL